MQPWQPASPFERDLLNAVTAGDSDAALTLIRETSLALPLTAVASGGREPAAWPVVTTPDRTWIVAYTSVESMRIGTGGAVGDARAATLPELAAAWPDHSYGLGINPGLPPQVTIEAGALARLAAPTLLKDQQLEPAATTPMMFKLLRHADVHQLLQANVARVSGYCHQVIDIASVETPEELIEALGRADQRAELANEEGSVNVLRWPAAGLELYRNAVGGTDELSRAAVDGWLIEEPPFVGLGFAAGTGHVIREYKVDGAALPHGAEICELTRGGEVLPRAYFDADRAEWQLLVPVAASSTERPTASEES